MKIKITKDEWLRIGMQKNWIKVAVTLTPDEERAVDTLRNRGTPKPYWEGGMPEIQAVNIIMRQPNGIDRLRKILKENCGYSDDEIKALMTKYNINIDPVLSGGELK